MKKISPAIMAEIVAIYNVIKDLEKTGIKKVTSDIIGDCLNQKPNTVRKHILAICPSDKTGGRKKHVKEEIKELERALRFNRKEIKACIIGLGNTGSFILDYFNKLRENNEPYSIVAGFDSNINRLETIKTDIELYPSYRMEEIIKQKDIKIAVIALPSEQLGNIVERCCKAGIKGFLNLSGSVIKTKNKNIIVRDINIRNEMTLITALLTTQKIKK
ncbi:MAG: Gfo/Idh/MocA family oxidoreductase [Chitinispirillaceae bacterium]|nr:Gfo/Idh/MocA family oxidoreductase [Chitinispirillaceae bacterium]